MYTNRRNFLRGLGAGGAMGLLGGCRMYACPTGAASAGDAKLKFGVLSDVHIRKPYGSADHRVDAFFLRRAFRYFRDQGADAVMIAGDLADNGLCEQLEAVEAVWEEVFPDGRAPDGRKVEKLFTTGNHDWEGASYTMNIEKLFPDPKVRAKKVISCDYAGNWERIMKEPYAPVFVKTVKGYTFIGSHWCSGHCNGKEESGVADPSETIARVAPTLDPAKPFFYFQHPQPKDTCYGKGCWGQDNGCSTKALSAYPNAVAFSGHSHYPLTDERTVWQGAFTSICTSSLRYTSIAEDLEEYVQKNGYENTNSRAGAKVDNEKVADDYTMKWQGQQGMLVEVYDDRMVIVRREFRFGNSLGDDWVIPLAFDGSCPMSEDRRKAKERPPRFPDKAEAKVSSGERTNRGGKKVPTWEISVPSATAEEKTRAYKYEVRMVLEDGTLFDTRYLLAPFYNMPLELVDCYCPVTIPLAKSQTPQDKPFRFEIVPISSLGTRGKPLAVSGGEVAK